MHEKTGHDNKGMSGHGFTFPVGGSVPVIFISMESSRCFIIIGESSENTSSLCKLICIIRHGLCKSFA